MNEEVDCSEVVPSIADKHKLAANGQRCSREQDAKDGSKEQPKRQLKFAMVSSSARAVVLACGACSVGCLVEADLSACAQAAMKPVQAATDAPGLGRIPSISAHYSALPSMYELDAQPMEHISPLIQRQFVTGAELTIVK